MSIGSVSILVLTIALAPSAGGDVAAPDPTNPADVATQSGTPDAGKAPLAGPDVQSSPSDDRRGGMGRGPEGRMMGASPSVQSLLTNSCGSCHGEQKQKGGVRMVPLGKLFEGDARDWVVVPGKPDESELLRRVMLPAGHEDVMPPKERPLTAEEVRMIRDWIAGGKTAEKLIGSAGGNGGQSRGIDQRTWGAVYMSLDLTAAQSRAARSAMQKLQKEMVVARVRPKAGDAQKPLAPDPAARAKREQLKQRISETQEALWNALTELQQNAMRTILADPDAVQAIQKANKGRRGRGRGRRDGDQSPPPRN
ncbi:MAG: hypothetical protein P8I91_01065 [Phycisphaerales bacterium]|nr:hypothetical protein [Phycisphaerales bacterium]